MPRLDRWARIQFRRVHFWVFSMPRFTPPVLSLDGYKNVTWFTGGRIWPPLVKKTWRDSWGAPTDLLWLKIVMWITEGPKRPPLKKCVVIHVGLDKAPRLSITIAIWIRSSDTICQLNQFNTKSEAAILSKQEQSGKEYICNSHWRLARLENKTSSAASSKSGLTLLELFIIVGDIRTLHLASRTGLVWVSGWESRRVASSERQKNVQSKTLLSTQSSSNTIYCVCFRETVAG